MSFFVTSGPGKNQYEKFKGVRARFGLHPVFSLIFIGFCMVFLILSVWKFNNGINHRVNNHVLYLNSRHRPLRIISDKFLSVGLDTSLLRDMESLPIKKNKFINLARNLAPAYVRIGGTAADCLYFNQTRPIISEKLFNPVDETDISNFTIKDVDFENLYNFVTKSKLQMIFDLNALIRNADGSWDITNAKNIISFAKKKNMILDWQLGNEPNSFRHVFNFTVSATQLASDYYKLRLLLNDMGYRGSLLVGPEVNHVGDDKHMGEQYAKTFLENDKDSVNYVTWHQYYLDGRVAEVTDFVNVSTFNYLAMQIESMNEAIELSGKNIPMWLSETSTAYGGGAPELSDRFVAGFLWLDKLGYSASAGVNVVTRQSLFGGHYAMIGPDLIPNPDWWVSVIYKQFVSEKVLDLSTPNNFGSVRFYAHCTPAKAYINNMSAITIYGININTYDVTMDISGIPASKIFLYILTSDNLQSRTIKMNGKVLQLQPNGNLPPFRPIVLESTELITLPPYSMVFIVLYDAEIPVCA